MRAFLSSTFRDLRFERNFVVRKLKTMGIDVVSMEADCKEDFDWRRWSANQARQCDLFIFLFDTRVGTQSNLLLDHLAFVSTSRMERDIARGKAIKLLEYRLERPFPDEEALFEPEERDEYLKTILTEDDPRYLTAGAQIEGMWRDGILIESVSELERRLEVDMRVSWTRHFFHKMRILRRSYFDENFCAWRHAYEDESQIASTHRLGLSWRLRKLIILPLISFAVLYLALPLTSAILCSALLLMPVLVMAIAYRPSFVWVGTKTIMARGLFGRFVQRPLNERFQLDPHWALLDRWTGLGALSVEFSDGVRIFVPLVNDPTAFARHLPAQIKERKRRTCATN
ncbi:DUF4062 domain-containing protein [Bradyrhizobium canariense]|nr:DUF4062 domain-containing protein [Bradyrhizobium canariense]